MHIPENCHENVWIFSGTSDGPQLVTRLLGLKYNVFVSVLTYKASKAYPKNPKLHIITGKLESTKEIINFIKKNRISFVVDATHPFALIISKNLSDACEIIKKPLLVFERKSEIKNISNIFYIEGLKDIKNEDLKNKNILLAIGSRYLDDTARYYLNCGANVFTRVIPTQESILRAFGSCINNSNIAILEPSKKIKNCLEKKLCDYWKIDYVLCRDSGSYSSLNWEEMIFESDMKLFLVKRPKLKYKNSYYFSKYDTLIKHMIEKNNS